MTYLKQLADDRKARLARMGGPAVLEPRPATKFNFILELPAHWQVTPVQALILLSLANTHDGFASQETIARVSRLRGGVSGTIRVHICTLRKMLKHDDIEIKTIKNKGFALTRHSLAKLRELSAT